MRARIVAALLALALAGASSSQAQAAGVRRISRTALEDKIRGGWAGQMIGVSYGAPTEFKSNGKIIEGEIKWSPEMIENSIHQDDLYVEMTFAEVMDKVGLDATTEQYGEMFKDSKYQLWHANAGARRNLNRGIKAPMSGHPKYNVHANDIDFQIESDFIGLMTPGLPQEANLYADRVGRVMNHGDGLYGGMFFGGMYAAAFFETDPRVVVTQGLLSIPAESGYARIIRDVLAWSAQHPDDWKKTWQLLEDKWNREDACPDGALAPFNIDARLNGAYVALGILYGGGDFTRTLDVSTRAGQDSDCNPSSAAGIVGVMLGYEKIPDVWKSGIPKLADTKFEFTSYSFNQIVQSTLVRALKVVAGAGGRVTAAAVEVPAQAPKAPPLEQWDPGPPTSRAEVDGPGWSWKGGWTTQATMRNGSASNVKEAAGAGDEATFTFEGTGVALVGQCTQEGGRADVFLDGRAAGQIDAWIPERTHDNDYWHATGLAAGKHTVRIVVRADADARSKGRKVRVQRAIVYGSPTGAAAGSDSSPAKQQVIASYAKLPLHFEANQGQTDEEVKFLARGRGYGLYLTSTELVLSLRKTEAGRQGKGLARAEAATPKRSGPPEVLRMKLLGADPRPAIEGKEELPGKSNYFIGNDPKRWRTDVPQYARVEYKSVYPGVSLTYYGNQGQLEYDFVVSTGGDPKQIRLGIEGAEKIRVDAQGNLVLSLPQGEVVQKTPVVYQEFGGVRRAVEGRFVLTGRAEVGFEVGAYDRDVPLVLDPVLVYSTYLGGSSTDFGQGIAVDASGNAYVMGGTTSDDFPTVNPLQSVRGGDADAIVSKLNAGGSALLYSTYLGGSDYDIGMGIAVDASGNAYVTGIALSTDFPTANPIQAANRGFYDAFVAKLNAAGSGLVYSTYLGGSLYDQAYGIAVDASGNAFITGDTGSTDFPTANPLQAAAAGLGDAFVAKLNAAGSALAYSTYLGGGSDDQGYGIAVDASGNAWVAGFTRSTDFPTANPLQAAAAGFGDAFVAKLNATGSAFAYSTYLGGGSGDYGTGIAVDLSGNAYITGATGSTDFPTANPLQAAPAGGEDAFVAKVNAPGSALMYSTYLGGSGIDQSAGVGVDASGSVYVTGRTTSGDFPTAHAVQAVYGGGTGDAFVAKVNPVGSALVYSTYLGGDTLDQGGGIAVDGPGNAYVTGQTESTNFPIANPLQAASGGFADAFVARIGIHTTSSHFFSITPCRVADTRYPVGPSGGPALGANTTRTFPVTGVCGIPPTASAVALIVTVVRETDAGDLRLYPAGSPAPSSSTISFAVQKVRANNSIVALGAGGQITVQCDMPTGSTGQTHFLFDVMGYFQ